MNKGELLGKIQTTVEEIQNQLHRIGKQADEKGLEVDLKVILNIRTAIKKLFKNEYRVYMPDICVIDDFSVDISKMADIIFTQIQTTRTRLLRDLGIVHLSKATLKTSSYIQDIKEVWQYLFTYPFDESKLIKQYQNQEKDISITETEYKYLLLNTRKERREL